MEKTSTGLAENVAGLLCYLGWWITGLVFILIEKENKVVRFHAMQSIIVFGAINIAYIILFWIPVIPILLWILAVVLWIILMIRTYQGAMLKLPLSGNLAEKWAG